MADRPLPRILVGAAVAQAALYLGTGIWPLVSLSSFEAVTGPKTDDWLVQTFGLLVAALGAVFLVAAVRRRLSVELAVLAISCALCLAFADVLFVSQGRISPVYLVDAAAEALLAVWWSAGLWRHR
ncbi:MAG: hypothetical protein WD069_03365 [Planctomycetales bacterium]